MERHLQESLSPLLMHVDRLATLPKGEAPTHRLAILQVRPWGEHCWCLMLMWGPVSCVLCLVTPRHIIVLV